MDAAAEAGIAEAFDCIEDFIAVQGPHLSAESVELLQESVGIDEATRATLRERLESLELECRGGQVLFGMIVGLLAAQLEGERY